MLNSDHVPRFELKYEDDLNGFITIESNSDYRNAISNATLLNLNKLILHVRIGDEEEFKQSVQRVKEEKEDVPSFIKDLEDEVGNPPGIVNDGEGEKINVGNLEEAVSEDGEGEEEVHEVVQPLMADSDQKRDPVESGIDQRFSFLDDVDDDDMDEQLVEVPIPVESPKEQGAPESSSDSSSFMEEPLQAHQAPIVDAEPVIEEEHIPIPEEEYKFEKILHQSELEEEEKQANSVVKTPEQTIPLLGPRKVSKPVGSIVFKPGDVP